MSATKALGGATEPVGDLLAARCGGRRRRTEMLLAKAEQVSDDGPRGRVDAYFRPLRALDEIL